MRLNSQKVEVNWQIIHTMESLLIVPLIELKFEKMSPHQPAENVQPQQNEISIQFFEHYKMKL